MKGLQPELSFKDAFCCIPALHGHSLVPARQMEIKRARKGEEGRKELWMEGQKSEGKITRDKQQQEVEKERMRSRKFALLKIRK